MLIERDALYGFEVTFDGQVTVECAPESFAVDWQDDLPNCVAAGSLHEGDFHDLGSALFTRIEFRFG